MNAPLISVIVPAFNAERFLAACLDSILTQSYKNIEVIIINDGSTDFTLEIAQTYSAKDDRIKIYSFDNEGLSEARNRGLSVATGEMITFVDADDMLNPEALRVLHETLVKEKADIVEGKTVRGISHENQVLYKHLKIKSFNVKEAIADVLYQHLLLPSVCGKLFKKDLFQTLRFEKGIFYEDLNIFYKIFEKCNKIVWINYPVYFYRINENSITNLWKTKRLDVLSVTENIETYIGEKYPDLLSSATDRRLSANFNMFALCSIHGDKVMSSKCWEIIRKYRKQSLFNPKVRLKNKAGILLSYLGKPLFNCVARRIYR